LGYLQNPFKNPAWIKKAAVFHVVCTMGNFQEIPVVQVAVVTLGALLLAGLFTAFGGKEGGGWGERVKCFF